MSNLERSHTSDCNYSPVTPLSPLGPIGPKSPGNPTVPINPMTPCSPLRPLMQKTGGIIAFQHRSSECKSHIIKAAVA